MRILSLKKTPLFQTLFFFTLIVLTISTFNSCEKDSVIEEPDPTDIVITHTEDLYTGSISGKVVNEDSEALEGVTIAIRGKEIITDENGFFSFQNIQLDAQGTVIKARKEDYWNITKMITPSKTQQNESRFMLQSKSTGKTIEASSGGEVSFNEAVKIGFSENAFVTTDGASYDGKVEILALYLDPHDEDFGMLSPGDFRAFDSESTLQTLVSLGMTGVELRGESNEILELRNETKATLSIKVPEGTDIEEVPLWHLDEASGYWLEEGIAEKIGGFYVGEVSHFSWWNCDVPYPVVKLSGSVLNHTGIGIAGLSVGIILDNEMWNLGVEYTGDEGMFSGWIPKDQNLTIQIINECGIIIFEEAIGSLDVDTELAPIILNDQNVVELQGNLINCNAEIVSNGYLVVNQLGNKLFVPVDDVGNFDAAVNICEATSFKLYGIDLDLGLQGFPVSYDVDESPINNLELNACDQLANVFSYQIDNDPEVIIADFQITTDNDGTIVAGGNEEVHGEFPGFILDGTNWGTSDFSLGYFNVLIASQNEEIDCDYFSCSSPSLEVLQYGGVGSPIVLKFTGDNYYGNTYEINLSGILEE